MFFEYSSFGIKTILSRYNRTNDDAIEYGNDCYEYFQIFKSVND